MQLILQAKYPDKDTRMEQLAESLVKICKDKKACVILNNTALSNHIQKALEKYYLNKKKRFTLFVANKTLSLFQWLCVVSAAFCIYTLGYQKLVEFADNTEL